MSVEERAPKGHPICELRGLVDTILEEMDALLGSRYAPDGDESIPPERLLRAALRPVVYSVRSERLLMEQRQCNLLFRWFVGLNVDDPVWNHATFSFNRDRLFDAEIAQQFFENAGLLARLNELASDEHCCGDRTLLEAWALHKSLRRKDSGEERRNATHASTIDSDARRMRKGAAKEAKLSYLANALRENRHGLIVGIDARHATGTAAREGCAGAGGTPRSIRRHAGCGQGYDVRAVVRRARHPRASCAT